MAAKSNPYFGFSFSGIAEVKGEKYEFCFFEKAEETESSCHNSNCWENCGSNFLPKVGEMFRIRKMETGEKILSFSEIGVALRHKVESMIAQPRCADCLTKEIAVLARGN